MENKRWMPQKDADFLEEKHRKEFQKEFWERKDVSLVEKMKDEQRKFNQRMEDHTKYYTPSIEDIRIGYQCQITTFKDIPDDKYWLDDILNIPEKIRRVLEVYPDKIRTPYLTKEQIEAEGWDFGNAHLLVMDFGEYAVDEILRIGRKGDFKLGYHFTGHKLKITRQEPNDPVLYNGKCPSINEFRTITKLLGI